MGFLWVHLRPLTCMVRWTVHYKLAIAVDVSLLIDSFLSHAEIYSVGEKSLPSCFISVRNTEHKEKSMTANENICYYVFIHYFSMRIVIQCLCVCRNVYEHIQNAMSACVCSECCPKVNKNHPAAPKKYVVFTFCQYAELFL